MKQRASAASTEKQNTPEGQLDKTRRLAVPLRTALLIHSMILVYSLATAAISDADISNMAATHRPLLLLLFLAWFPLFLLWLFRVSELLHMIADPPPATSPGWAVELFFVPVLLLFRPFQVVRDLWSSRMQCGEWMVAIWWLSWIAAIVLYILETAWRSSGDFDWANQMLLLGFGVDLASIAALWYIVDRINDANRKLVAAFDTGR